MSWFTPQCKSEYVAEAISTGFLGRQAPSVVSEILRCKYDRGHKGAHAQMMRSQVAYTWTDSQSLEVM